MELNTDIANSKIKEISGLKNLTKLRKIDLGANRIRVMDEEELGGLINLEELWIGKNKIENIQGLEKVRVRVSQSRWMHSGCDVLLNIFFRATIQNL